MPYKDPEKARENKKKYYQENKEKIREQRKKWEEENPEYMNKWYEKNKEKKIEASKKWNEENPEKVRENRKKRKKERYHTDPCYKLRHLSSVMVRVALKEGKGGESMLPYVDWNSYKELEEHLESQFEDWMTWENHGMWHPTERRWHIDHIIPQSKLLYDSMDHPNFQKCWALENLRPLEAKENMSKGNKIINE